MAPAAEGPKKRTVRRPAALSARGPLLRLRLIRSMSGSKPKMKATIVGLGFKRTHQVVERLDTPEIRGMIAKVSHWVQVIDGGK